MRSHVLCLFSSSGDMYGLCSRSAGFACKKFSNYSIKLCTVFVIRKVQKEGKQKRYGQLHHNVNHEKLTKETARTNLGMQSLASSRYFSFWHSFRLRQSTYLTDVQFKLILRKVPHPPACSSAYKIRGIRARRMDFFKELSITGNTNTPTVKTVGNFEKIKFIRAKNNTICQSHWLKRWYKLINIP